ncbi:hypothetical protein D3C80_1706080 [compost metagenome]
MGDRPERYAAGQTKHVWHDDKNVGRHVEGVTVGKTRTARAGIGGDRLAGAGKLARHRTTDRSHCDGGGGLCCQSRAVGPDQFNTAVE